MAEGVLISLGGTPSSPMRVRMVGLLVEESVLSAAGVIEKANDSAGVVDAGGGGAQDRTLDGVRIVDNHDGAVRVTTMAITVEVSDDGAAAIDPNGYGRLPIRRIECCIC